MFLWKENVAWDFYMASYSATLTDKDNGAAT